MGEIERNSHAGRSVRREPVVRQPRMRAKENTARLELPMYFDDASFDRRTVDGNAEGADPHVEQVLVSPTGPDRLLAVAAGLFVGRRHSGFGAWCAPIIEVGDNQESWDRSSCTR